MAEFTLLLLPSGNRVYTRSAIDLTQAELTLFGDACLDATIGSIQDVTLGGVPYIRFTADALSERDVARLANLSSIYALFRVEGDGLVPLAVRPLDRFDDDLITTQRYPGKTNELFTKLLLNVTLLSSAFADQLLTRRFRVLDPLCGRGTTLNQALMYGFDAAGVEADRKDFDAYSLFLQTWLKRARLKHDVEVSRLRQDGRVVGHRLQASLGVDKESWKNGDKLNLMYINADTLNACDHFRPAAFDLVVTDAPYGVQHGSRSGSTGWRRSPLALLREAVPVWANLVRPGGAVGIAWNTNVAERAEATAVLTEAGLEPVHGGPYDRFEHRVDQAIVRDIIVARRGDGGGRQP